MIRLEGLTKTYQDAGRPAVDGIDLEVAEGTTCALIGPSGCGKTTTLRMINRLVEPTAGRILIEGRDVASSDPVSLRRGIGYVIQSVGLFPHMSVGENIATVPRLLGWPATRIGERVDAMLALVGLDPGEFRERRPDSLSGGQRQRIGVARALAADPPVLLMDEPFGAVDPLARSHLQREVASILRRLGKTVVLVTHDIDEAVRMADRIAVMNEGRIVRHDTPDRLLAAPADAFVAEFVGEGRTLRRLSLRTVGRFATPGPVPDGLPVLPADAGLDRGLSAMLASGQDAIGVTGPDGRFFGVLTLDALRVAASAGADRA